MKPQITRKMLLKAPIVQILQAECCIYLLSGHLTSVIHDKRFFLCFVAIAKNLYNVRMPKFLEVVKLIFELHIFRIDIRILQFLHSNNTTVFSHSLQNIYAVSTQYKLATFLCTSYSIIFGRYEINVGFGFIFVC